MDPSAVPKDNLFYFQIQLLVDAFYQFRKCFRYEILKFLAVFGPNDGQRLVWLDRFQ